VGGGKQLIMPIKDNSTHFWSECRQLHTVLIWRYLFSGSNGPPSHALPKKR
jgi:hypothetical protein